METHDTELMLRPEYTQVILEKGTGEGQAKKLYQIMLDFDLPV